MNAEAKIKSALHSALAAAFPAIEGATKDSTNPHFKSQYADLASVIAAIKPALVGQGLFFTQGTEPSEGGVIVETMVHHSSGESMSFGKLFVPANKNDAQGFGSALTYARRYSLMTAFGVAPEDDDGNAASKAIARPTTGEAPPEKRASLVGPYTSKTALQGAVKALAATLENIGDTDELNALMETKDFIELEKQAVRDLPSWWETGDGLPEEFVPMIVRIERRKKELETAETAANYMRAG
jgi:hypothetical protein